MKWSILGIIIATLILITPVYAFSFDEILSWISNFFGSITGYVTNITDCPYECCLNDPAYTNKVCEYPKTCKDYKCTDVETTTTQISTIATTIEITTTTIQRETTITTSLPVCPYDCCPPDKGYETKICEYPKTCIDGKCIETVTTIQISCTDSDGKDYYRKGTAKDQFGEKTDYCQNENDLTEYWCGPGTTGEVVWTTASIPCTYGCRDGACLPVPTPVCGNKVCEGETERASCPQDCNVKCNQDADCGQPTSYKTCDYTGMPAQGKLPDVSYACTVEKKYKCENPGTFDSRCVDVVGASCLPCQYGCQNGICVSETPQVGICRDYDGLNYYLKSHVEEYGNKYFDTCRVINSDTDYYDTDECSENCYVLEASCTDIGTPRTQAWKCPSNVCKDGACIKVEVKEQVRCLFANLDSTQTCFTEDKKFTCSGTSSCTVDVYGEKGTTLLWKSTCGDHTSTILDGNNDDAKFNCIPPSDVTEQQIIGRAFDRAYWQCYDGVELTAEDINDVDCNVAEAWKNAAELFCKQHCKEAGGITKCGVNSFGVSGDCYVDMEKFVVIVPNIEEKPGTEIKPPEAQPTEITLICKDSCPSDGKCYPFGYRKEEKYCSDDGAFKQQLESDETCENNFECESNVCVSGKCISSGLMQRIIDWFKKLFGTT